MKFYTDMKTYAKEIGLDPKIIAVIDFMDPAQYNNILINHVATKLFALLLRTMDQKGLGPLRIGTLTLGLLQEIELEKGSNAGSDVQDGA